MSIRPLFSPALYLVAQASTILALILPRRPNPPHTYPCLQTLQPLIYPLLILPPIYGYLRLAFETTTGNAAADFAIGSLLLTQLLIAIDYTLLTDIHKDLRMVGESGDHGNTLTQTPDMPRANAGRTRVYRGLHLFVNARGVGWEHKPTFLLTVAPRLTTRRAFVMARLQRVCVCTVFTVASHVVNGLNPAFVRFPGNEAGLDGDARRCGWMWRIIGVLGFGASASATMMGLHAGLGAIVVGLGVSDACDWPDLFGSVWEAYSIERFWSRVWHQLLRRSLLRTTHVVMVDVMGIRQRTAWTGVLRVVLVFALSGLIHTGGEYMLLNEFGAGSMLFFVVQPAGIVLERMVKAIWASAGRGVGWRLVIERATGYIWVLAWFTWCGPFILDPMIRGAVFPALSS